MSHELAQHSPFGQLTPAFPPAKLNPGVKFYAISIDLLNLDRDLSQGLCFIPFLIGVRLLIV
jgi:hypothetical protein